MIITSFTVFDYNWYHVSSSIIHQFLEAKCCCQLFLELLDNSTYWLGCFVLITLLVCKDILWYGYWRYFCPQSYHIVQEIEVSEAAAKAFERNEVAIDLADMSPPSPTGTGLVSNPLLGKI
jgi:hypothetical protein